MEPGVWTPEETLAGGSGSCRDSAWVLVQVLRHLGYGGALRLRLPDPARRRREAAGRAGRARRPTSPTCMPGPRSTCPAPAGSAWTPPPACCAARATSRSPPAPIRSPPRRSPAWWSSARSTFDFDMQVRRGSGRPRASPSRTRKRSGRTSWPRGAAVDRALARGDVRLTMGGEPTFVSATDIDAPEWNTDALGPTKRPMPTG